jgi:hypothetical protein
MGRSRGLSKSDVLEQAEALRGYMLKPQNRGVSFWLNSKAFNDGDREAVLLAWGRLVE